MNNVYRCYAEKRPGFDVEAGKVYRELREQLGIEELTGVRILYRYDVDRIDRSVFEQAARTVFSEPMCDDYYEEEMPPIEGAHTVLAVEALPGQFDQRADSCAQCIQLLAGCDRPLVSAATVYVLLGALGEGQVERIARYLINPVESRRAGMEKPQTLEQTYAVPTSVPTLEGFIAQDRDGLAGTLERYSLAMDLDDLAFLQAYFRDQEHRDPTLTELRVVDTYWSDHCRHTTFGTRIETAEIEDDGVRAAYDADKATERC